MSEPPSDNTQNATPRSGPAPVGAATAAGGDVQRIGRFEIRQVLGEGAFGRVYRGFDPELQRDVAIKVPHAQGMTADLRERFLREARAAATIHHPNVCQVYQVGTDGDLPYIVMRFVHGPTLGGILAQRKNPFPTRHAAAIVRKLSLAVAAAHAKEIIHRDLKPGNILVDETTWEVFLTDFGLARFGGEGRMTAQGDVLGTPAYMSPEQARGDVEAVGPPADVYALGVILYHLTTGVLPFRGTVSEVMAQVQNALPKPPSAARPGIGRSIDSLCLKR